MDLAVAVRLGNLMRIDVFEPVVGSNGAAVVQDEPAQRIAHVGVLVDAPVFLFEIAVHGIYYVKENVLGCAHAPALLAVQNEGLGHARVAVFDEDLLDQVLDLFHGGD